MHQTMDNAIGEYLDWRHTQGFAKATVKNDGTSLRYLMSVLGPSRFLADIDHHDVARSLHLALEKRSPQTVNMFHACYSGFFRWCRMNKYMQADHDPLLGTRYRKVAKKERHRLSIGDFPAFLDAAPDARHRMFSALGLYLFLRASEAVNLRWRDVNLDDGSIGVTIQKTHDFDVMPISRELDDELRQWLLTTQDLLERPVHPDWYVVPTVKFHGHTYWRLQPEGKISRPHDLVKRHLTSYGWEDTHWEGMHCLRRSGARAWFDELVDQGTDGALRLVQTQLHHASVTMTERYLGLTADRIKRDRTLKGVDMFPSIVQNAKVIPIHRAG